MLNKSGFAPIITIIIIAVMSGLSLLAYQTVSKKSSPNSAKINSVTKPTQTPSPNLTAYLSCLGPSGSLGNHVNLVLSGYVLVQVSDGIWGEITDTKLNKTVNYLYGDRYQTNLGVTFQDTIGSIRGEGSLKLYGDSRVYLIKVFNAPYTAGIPTEGTTLVQANVSKTCLTYPIPTATPNPSVTPTSTQTATNTPTPNSTITSSGSNDSATPTPTVSNTPTPTPSPTSTPAATATPIPAPVTVNTNSVSVTLSSSNPDPSNLVYGSGFTITSNSAIAWLVYNNNPQDIQNTQGVGFYESSGGITPGASATIRTYINAVTKPKGTYNGSVTIKYQLPGGQGQYYNGPTVSYSITLQ